jgi:hypothetical protein
MYSSWGNRIAMVYFQDLKSVVFHTIFKDTVNKRIAVSYLNVRKQRRGQTWWTAHYSHYNCRRRLNTCYAQFSKIWNLTSFRNWPVDGGIGQCSCVSFIVCFSTEIPIVDCQNYFCCQYFVHSSRWIYDVLGWVEQNNWNLFPNLTQVLFFHINYHISAGRLDEHAAL